jgi:hypothetical protein
VVCIQENSISNISLPRVVHVLQLGVHSFISKSMLEFMGLHNYYVENRVCHLKPRLLQSFNFNLL